jgi:peptidase E
VPAQTPTIVATSIGLPLTGRGPDDRRLGPAFAHAAELAGVRGRPPCVCLVATAVGDAAERLCLLYSAFGRAGWQTSHLALFPQPNQPDVEAHLMAQDVVWVNGGSAANLLALWRLHGIDAAMTAAWRAGVVLMGSSAGSLCWFLGGTTDSFGQPLRQLEHGLGLLPYSNSPHHDSEPQRRPTFQRLIAEGSLPDGYASDDGAGLVFEGTELVDCIAEVEGASAWEVRRLDDGSVEETRLPTRLLG